MPVGMCIQCWGMLPFVSDYKFELNDIVIVYDVKKSLMNGDKQFSAKVVRGDEVVDVVLNIDALTDDEREIIKQGCLINYYRSQM